MKNSQIIKDIRQRMNTYPMNVRRLLNRYNRPITLSVENIIQTAATFPQFEREFYATTGGHPLHNADGENSSLWVDILGGVGGAFSGFAGGYNARDNAEANREINMYQATASAEIAHAEATSKRTTMIIVGVVAAVAVLGAIYFMTAKK